VDVKSVADDGGREGDGPPLALLERKLQQQVMTMRLSLLMVVLLFLALRLLSVWFDTTSDGDGDRSGAGAGCYTNCEEERVGLDAVSVPTSLKTPTSLLDASKIPPSRPTTTSAASPDGDDDDDEFEYDYYRGHGFSSSSPAPSVLPFFDVGNDHHHEESSSSSRQPNDTIKPPLPAQMKNLRLVFLGDSLTRYQYLSLAYYLRFGRWFDPHIKVNNLVNAHSFHHPLHPKEDWNEFFLQSNRILHPLEVCDCLRSHDGSVVLERRYFYDATHNNLLTYINMNGGKETSPGHGYYGRLEPERIFGSGFFDLEHLPFGLDTSGGYDESSIEWDFPTWGDVIRYHVGSLDYGYNAKGLYENGRTVHVLLNAGLHPHDFGNVSVAADIQEALAESSLHGVWKTTTYPLPDLIEYQALLKFSWQSSSSSSGQKDRAPYTRHTDREMCAMIGSCFNVSWTALLRPEFYFDDLHFLEPVYRVLNEEYLAQLNLLPKGYEKMDRSTILIDGASRWLP
jgi:hypothetical protein